MGLTKIGTDGVKDDAVTTDKLANAINTERTANTAKVSTTINNNADNRVITGSGTANTLEGEAGLTYNGSSSLVISGSGQQQLTIGSTDAGGAVITLDGDSNGDGAGGDYSFIRHNTDGDIEIFARNTGGATNTIFKQSTSEKVRIQAGGGISFNGDTAAANALDDYEEGTWTPSFTQGVSGGSYSSQTGHYTKVGRLVMISCRIDGNGLSATNDHLLLGGLPFTSVSSGGTAGGLYFAYSDNFYSGSSGTNLALTIIVNNNATVCEFFDGDGTQKRGDDFYDVNRNIHLIGTYHTG